MSARIATIVQLTLAASIFYLGYTIHAMTSKVSDVLDTYPQVLADVSALSKSLQVEEWLLVADTLKELIPEMVTSVNDTTGAIKEVNQTAASINAKIPLVLEEVTQYRQSVIPNVVHEAQRYRVDVIPPMLVESRGYRVETVPHILTESQALRSEIPPILAQADLLVQKTDQIMDKSQELAKQATQGAMKGVILSPIDLIREAGAELKVRATSVIDE